jgi:glycine/D-amino acid oxidase-like deaminating enzyme/bacterioferritin-associated ferredoxin
VTAPLRFTFDGVPLAGRAGDSIASALIATGHAAWCASADGPRGLWCGIGYCHDCLVTVDGAASRRACMTLLTEGMAVSAQSARHAPARAMGALPDLGESACDVLVVGAGPAGLAAAAAALGGSGLAIRLVEERSQAGGQFYKQALAGGPRDAQQRAGAAVLARVRAAGIRIETGTLVWGAFRPEGGGLEIGLLSSVGRELVRPRRLVIATGAIEHVPPFPGWTLPGVMTVGAAQTLLRAHGRAPPGPVLVAGNGPLGLQLACELLRAGVPVAAVAEAAPPPWRRPAAGFATFVAGPRLALCGLAMLATLRRAGVPVLHGHHLTAIRPDAGGLAATLTGPGTALRVRAASVCAGYGFLPAAELPRLLGCVERADGAGGVLRGIDGSTSQADVFVIGEAGGWGGAQAALAQGRLAGLRLGAELRGISVRPERTARRRLRRAGRFQRHLARLFAAPDRGLALADPDTPLCRCEGITLRALRDAVAAGAEDLGTLKRLTRAGMGRCQGRLCTPVLQALLPDAAPVGFAPQVPLRPVPVAALAAAQPEWSGHRRLTLPPPRPLPARPVPAEATVVVVGAGIVGLATALHLARAGTDVVVLDQGTPGAAASGGNAGSLHVQLLAFEAGGGGPPPDSLALRTLPLQHESVALWRQLAAETGADLELAITGGLMVAATSAELDGLARKAAAERAAGIPVDLIDAAALYRLEPALAPGLHGAAWCAEEGKINPMRATETVRRAAASAGACLLPGRRVKGIAPLGDGFRLDTPGGAIRAARVVNAAGAWAGAVAALAGLSLPVHGAPLQMLVTEPATPLLTRLVARAGRHLTLKQAAGGTLVIGGGWTAGLDPVHAHPRPLRASLAGNLAAAQAVVPALGGLHVVRSWAAMNIDIDGGPVLGENPALPGWFDAVTSNGFTLGPVMGRITARLVAGAASGRDIAAFSAARFGPVRTS